MKYVIHSFNEFDIFETEVEALEEFNYRLYEYKTRFDNDDIIVTHSKNEKKIFLVPLIEVPLELCHYYIIKGGEENGSTHSIKCKSTGNLLSD